MSEERNKRRNRPVRGAAVGFWSIVLLVALFLFLHKAGILTYSYWELLATWQIVLFVISVCCLWKRKWICGSFLLFAAVFFWIPVFKAQFPHLLPTIPQEGFVRMYWYLLIVFFAFLMIVKQLFGKRGKQRWEHWEKTNCCKSHVLLVNEEKEGFIESNAVFNSNERAYLNEDFTGGKFNAVFGSQKMDLRKCVIHNHEKAQLEVNVVFGNCEIWIPADWNVQFKVDGVFSSVEDVRIEKPTDDSSKNRLLITGSCVFSNLEIRN